MASILLTHPDVLAFVNLITQSYDLRSDEDVVDRSECGEWVEVQVMNPPYNEPEYMGPFLSDITQALYDAGFRKTGPGHVTRVMRKGQIEARVENVDNDEEPIVVEFHEILR